MKATINLSEENVYFGSSIMTFEELGLNIPDGASELCQIVEWLNGSKVDEGGRDICDEFEFEVNYPEYFNLESDSEIDEFWNIWGERKEAFINIEECFLSSSTAEEPITITALYEEMMRFEIR